MGLTALFFSLPALELLKFFWSGRVSCHVSACTAVGPQSRLEVPQYPCLVKGSCKVCLSRSVPLFFSDLPLCVASNRTQKTLLSLGTSFSFPACCKEMKTGLSLSNIFMLSSCKFFSKKFPSEASSWWQWTKFQKSETDRLHSPQTYPQAAINSVSSTNVSDQ